MKSEHGPTLTALYICTDGKTRTLTPAQPIPLGVQFAATVSLDRARFIYVGRMSRTAGITALLFPHAGAPPYFPADEPVRIPADGTWFTLDRIAADEKLCVILASRELDKGTTGLRGGDEGEPPPPPPFKDDHNRIPDVRLLEIPVIRERGSTA